MAIKKIFDSWTCVHCRRRHFHSSDIKECQEKLACKQRQAINHEIRGEQLNNLSRRVH